MLVVTGERVRAVADHAGRRGHGDELARHDVTVVVATVDHVAVDLDRVANVKCLLNPVDNARQVPNQIPRYRDERITSVM